jgi:PLP dependent protein
MSHTQIEKLANIKSKILRIAREYNHQAPIINIVTKKRDISEILPLIESGERCFAENAVQELDAKWSKIKEIYPGIKLSLIGHLQSNKVKKAIEIVNVIETIDSEKIANLIKQEILIQNKEIELMIQVNIGEESQKYGIMPNEANSFISYCQNDLSLNIKGLMAIPPQDENPSPFFSLLQLIARRNGLNYLSMGMSSDYAQAIMLGTNEVRIGTKIFT